MSYWVKIKDGNLVQEARSLSQALSIVRELEELDLNLDREREYEIVNENEVK